MGPEETITNIIRESLIQSYQDSIEVPSEDNEELLLALKRVIEYYSTKSQYDDWLKEEALYVENFEKEKEFWASGDFDSYRETKNQEIWDRLAKNDKVNMMTDRVFIATACSQSVIWEQKVVIRAGSVAEAQTKFFNWLQTQDVYEHL